MKSFSKETRGDIINLFEMKYYNNVSTQITCDKKPCKDPDENKIKTRITSTLWISSVIFWEFIHLIF